MAARSTPRKPSLPLGAIVFSATGKVSKSLEPLPESKLELEGVTVRKFAGALAHFEGRQLSDVHPGQEDGHDYCACEGDRQIEIQVVEVLNSDHAAKRALQQEYTRGIRASLEDIWDGFAGIDIQLNDGYQEPAWPTITKRAGKAAQRMMDFIVKNLRACLPALQLLAVGQYRLYRWEPEFGVYEVGAFCRRFAAHASGRAGSIGCSGSFPQSTDTAEALLAGAVQRKVDKHYAKPSRASLWLLAYGNVGQAVVEGRAAALAKDILAKSQHPFEEVWYIFPYPDEDLGSIERIWP
ncbi:MAG: hypothetical protein WEE64_16315 [Dehalococcoidia bacterium]